MLHSHFHDRLYATIISPGDETTFFYSFYLLGRKPGPKFFETIVFRLIKSKICTKIYAADLYFWYHKGH